MNDNEIYGLVNHVLLFGNVYKNYLMHDEFGINIDDDDLTISY